MAEHLLYHFVYMHLLVACLQHPHSNSLVGASFRKHIVCILLPTCPALRAFVLALLLWVFEVNVAPHVNRPIV